MMINVEAVKLGNFQDEKSKDILKKALREGIVQVEFKKLDGSHRTMNCTLQENEIPAEKMPKTTSTSKNEKALPVFDTEIQAWRSFRWDSIQKFGFYL